MSGPGVVPFEGKRAKRAGKRAERWPGMEGADAWLEDVRGINRTRLLTGEAGLAGLAGLTAGHLDTVGTDADGLLQRNIGGSDQ